MSLVEKALRKLQASGAAPRPPESALGPIRPVEPTSVGGTSASPGSQAPAPVVPRKPLGMARTVHVDLEQLRRNAMVPPRAEERMLADQFRRLKRPLVEHAAHTPIAEGGSQASPRSVIVTSALPGDGKSFTAVNLALSMAREKDYSVVLVDADVAKQHLSRVFGLAGAPGLLDVVMDSTLSIESVISPTDIAGLSVLPAGVLSDSATELLASARTRALISQLIGLDRHCLVVVDSPPILLTTEANVLAGLCGQIVLVVRAGVTPQHAVLDAIRALGSKERINLLLNGIGVGAHPGYYAEYGHGYGYGEQHSSDEARTTDD